MTDKISPADLQALATRADELASEIEGADKELRGAAGHVGYRLGDVAGGLQGAAEDIRRMAEDLARIRARETLRRPCTAQWGVCPEHGNALVSSGGRSWCKASGCGRSWDWDRVALPCTEPATFRVRDAQGKEMQLCPGHTLAARTQLLGATVEPIQGGKEGGRRG